MFSIILCSDRVMLLICRSVESNLFSVMGSMYGAVLFIGVNNSSTVQPVVAIERTIFYRERAAGMYSAIPYAIAQVQIFSAPPSEYFILSLLHLWKNHCKIVNDPTP